MKFYNKHNYGDEKQINSLPGLWVGRSDSLHRGKREIVNDGNVLYCYPSGDYMMEYTH